MRRFIMRRSCRLSLQRTLFIVIYLIENIENFCQFYPGWVINYKKGTGDMAPPHSRHTFEFPVSLLIMAHQAICRAFQVRQVESDSARQVIPDTIAWMFPECTSLFTMATESRCLHRFSSNALLIFISSPHGRGRDWQRGQFNSLSFFVRHDYFVGPFRTTNVLNDHQYKRYHGTAGTGTR